MPVLEVRNNALDPSWILALMNFPHDDSNRRAFYAIQLLVHRSKEPATQPRSSGNSTQDEVGIVLRLVLYVVVTNTHVQPPYLLWYLFQLEPVMPAQLPGDWLTALRNVDHEGISTTRWHYVSKANARNDPMTSGGQAQERRGKLIG
jgi:hypothetical protein